MADDRKKLIEQQNPTGKQTPVLPAPPTLPQTNEDGNSVLPASK